MLIFTNNDSSLMSMDCRFRKHLNLFILTQKVAKKGLTMNPALLKPGLFWRSELVPSLLFLAQVWLLFWGIAVLLCERSFEWSDYVYQTLKQCLYCKLFWPGLVHFKLIDWKEKEVEAQCSGPIDTFWMMSSAKRQLGLNCMKYKEEVYYVKQCVTLK